MCEYRGWEMGVRGGYRRKDDREMDKDRGLDREVYEGYVRGLFFLFFLV